MTEDKKDEFLVRKYTPADLACIMDIANRAWKGIRRMARNALGDKIADLINPSGDDVSKGEQVQHTAAVTPEHVFVCEKQGKIVGFITFSFGENGIAEIGNNAVDPESGVKGAGQAMYRTVLTYFKKLGMKAVCVNTGLDEAHARARRAYERAGFVKNLKSVKYYMDLDDYE